jgi:hypothetical protein
MISKAFIKPFQILIKTKQGYRLRLVLTLNRKKDKNTEESRDKDKE